MITSTILNDNYTLPTNKRVAIGIRTNGCSWAKEKNGGCIHCAIHNSEICSNDYSILVDRFENDFKKYNFSEINALTVFTPGSFFDEKELPITYRDRILKIISNNKNIKEVLFESLPKFITEEKAIYLKKLFPNTNIIIGIGLDDANDYRRKKIINKNFKYKEYANTCSILKKHLIYNLTYILVKPPFVTEQESIFNAIDSAKKAFNDGANIVSLEIMNVQKGTKVFELYKINKFKPPWLWSVVEIIKEVNSFGVVKIGLFNYPYPFISSQNCRLCSQKIIDSFQLFNITNNIADICKTNCVCRTKWEKEMIINIK